MFILKSIKSANSGAWSVPILACFCFMRLYSVTSIDFYVIHFSRSIRNDVLDFFFTCFPCFFRFYISSVIVTKSAGNCNGKLHYLCSAIRRLFLWNLSSNSIDFADASSAFKRSSSMVLNSVFKFFILFSTKGSTSSIFFFFFGA